MLADVSQFAPCVGIRDPVSRLNNSFDHILGIASFKEQLGFALSRRAHCYERPWTARCHNSRDEQLCHSLVLLSRSFRLAEGRSQAMINWRQITATGAESTGRGFPTRSWNRARAAGKIKRQAPRTAQIHCREIGADCRLPSSDVGFNLLRR